MFFLVNRAYLYRCLCVFNVTRLHSLNFIISLLLSIFTGPGDYDASLLSSLSEVGSRLLKLAGKSCFFAREDELFHTFHHERPHEAQGYDSHRWRCAHLAHDVHCPEGWLMVSSFSRPQLRTIAPAWISFVPKEVVRQGYKSHVHHWTVCEHSAILAQGVFSCMFCILFTVRWLSARIPPNHGAGGVRSTPRRWEWHRREVFRGDIVARFSGEGEAECPRAQCVDSIERGASSELGSGWLATMPNVQCWRKSWSTAKPRCNIWRWRLPLRVPSPQSWMPRSLSWRWNLQSRLFRKYRGSRRGVVLPLPMMMMRRCSLKASGGMSHAWQAPCLWQILVRPLFQKSPPNFHFGCNRSCFAAARRCRVSGAGSASACV